MFSPVFPERSGIPMAKARHFAAEMGHLSVVRRLCDLKADVEAEKMQGGGAWGVTGAAPGHRGHG